MGCLFLCDRNRHLEVKDVADDGLNCILSMAVAVTSGVKVKTPHVVEKKAAISPFASLHILQRGMQNI